MLIKVCAWCRSGRLFGKLAEALGLNVSHGACRGCYERILAECEAVEDRQLS